MRTRPSAAGLRARGRCGAITADSGFSIGQPNFLLTHCYCASKADQSMEQVPLLRALILPAKKWLRGPYHSARTRYVRWRHGFGRAELLSALDAAGLRRGDAVLLHS